MKKQLPIGIHDYKELVEEGYYYVDKTEFIKEVWESGKAILTTRPGRFGKTINLSMLRYFFEQSATSHTHLFEDKKIWQHTSLRVLQGTYPVIYLTFKGVSFDTYQETYEKIASIMALEFQRHQYVYEQLDSVEKDLFQRILRREASHVDLCDSIEHLARFLARYHNKKVIILIDEYDVPVQRAFLHGFFEKIMNLMRPLLTSAFKDNTILAKGVITGILTVAKSGMFTGLNNLSMFTITNTKYADKFGFTHDEVTAILEYYDIANTQIQEWYNGYTFGINRQLYNPWSVMRCVEEKGVTAPYWVKTSSDNTLITNLIAKASPDMKADLELLLTGTTVEQPIEEAITFTDLSKNTNLAWSMLLYSGYLTFTECVDREGLKLCKLTIPNKEIFYLYRNLKKDIFKESITGGKVQSLLTALLENNVDTFLSLLESFVVTSMSMYDLQKPERSYHLFVLGLLVNLSDTFDVISNRESGDGRYDIMIVPRSQTGSGVVIEFKVAKNNLEETARKALQQIHDKNYAQELMNKGIYPIILYGIAFQGKKVALVSQLVEESL